MDAQQVTDLLAARFTGAGTDLAVDEHSLKVGGLVAWAGFAELDQIERQHAVWAHLRANLSTDDLRHIGLILTFTPDEVAAMAES